MGFSKQGAAKSLPARIFFKKRNSDQYIYIYIRGADKAGQLGGKSLTDLSFQYIKLKQIGFLIQRKLIETKCTVPLGAL